MTWTEEEITQLRKLAREGLSGAQIAERFGITRNAILGKCHRLGIKLQGKRPGRPKAARRTTLREDVSEANHLIQMGAM